MILASAYYYTTSSRKRIVLEPPICMLYPETKRNNLESQTGHLLSMALRPFLVTILWASSMGRFCLHFTQKASITVFSLPTFFVLMATDSAFWCVSCHSKMVAVTFWCVEAYLL